MSIILLIKNKQFHFAQNLYKWSGIVCVCVCVWPGACTKTITINEFSFPFIFSLDTDSHQEAEAETKLSQSSFWIRHRPTHMDIRAPHFKPSQKSDEAMYILLGERARAFPVSQRALSPLILTRQSQTSQQVFMASPSALQSRPHAQTPCPNPNLFSRDTGKVQPSSQTDRGKHSSSNYLCEWEGLLSPSWRQGDWDSEDSHPTRTRLYQRGHTHPTKWNKSCRWQHLQVWLWSVLFSAAHQMLCSATRHRLGFLL